MADGGGGDTAEWAMDGAAPQERSDWQIRTNDRLTATLDDVEVQLRDMR